MASLTQPPREHRLIARPRLPLFAALLAVLVFAAAASITPFVGSEEAGALGFWWERIAPRAYALHYFSTTRAFFVWDRLVTCSGPEHRLSAWRNVAMAPQADSAFESLFARARPAGRLYALAGLAFARAPSLEAALERARRDSSAVWVRDDIGLVARFGGHLALTVAEDRWIRDHYGPGGYRLSTVAALVREADVGQWARTLAETSAACAT